MANPATRWEDQVDAGPAWTLRVAGEDERRVAEFRAKVREAGERWRHTRTTGLTELLCAAAADDPELVWLARAGGQLLEDFLEGFGRNAEKTSLDHASDLIDGEQLPHEVLNRLAEAYVVVVTRSMVEGPAAGDRTAAPGDGTRSCAGSSPAARSTPRCRAVRAPGPPCSSTCRCRCAGPAPGGRCP